MLKKYSSMDNSSSDNIIEMDAVNQHQKQKFYKKHFIAVLERCERLQQDNERLVYRIHQVSKQLRRVRVERKFIMDRLDKHRDSWREATLQIDLGNDSPISDGVNIKHPGTSDTPNSKRHTNVKSTEKKDPNLPKRPANPFFRFCQEQRPIVLDQIIMSGEGEPTKQDLTKRLAITWNTMGHNDKKVYYDMYERSKEKYAADMEEYTLTKAINAVQPTSS